jgi:hypothetical protein
MDVDNSDHISPLTLGNLHVLAWSFFGYASRFSKAQHEEGQSTTIHHDIFNGYPS